MTELNVRHYKIKKKLINFIFGHKPSIDIKNATYNMWFYNMGIIWIYIGSIEVDFRYSWIKILEFIQGIPKFRQLWEKFCKILPLFENFKKVFPSVV